MAFESLEPFIRDAFGRTAATALGSPPGFQLHGSIGINAFLRGDGSVWVESDELDQVEQVERREVFGVERLTNLVIAVERRPTLAGLLPIRTDASRVCARCEGEGSVPLTEAEQRPGMYLRMGASPLRVYCRACGGLGFV